MKKKFPVLVIVTYLMTPVFVFSQKRSDSLMEKATLRECIEYALNHQPLVHQSLIDEDIAEATIKSKLAEWYPQLNLSYNIQHNLLLPTLFIPDANGVKRELKTGVKNSSNFQFTLNQAIFNQDVLLAKRTAKDIRTHAKQSTVANKIDIIVDVSKGYYDLLLTQKQVLVLDENILRLERSLKDAYNQYEGGIVDKTDYKRAQISLNNTKAEKKRTEELAEAKFAYLKELIGYPANANFSIIYDSLQMEREAFIDTLQQVQFSNRVESQLLQTQHSLLQANLRYYKWSYFPSVSAFGNYTPTFQSDRFADLYDKSFPTSSIGLQLTLPIFQGGKRVHNVHNANLQLTRLQWDITALDSRVSAEYAQALAAYKANLADWNFLKENMVLAEDVYNTLRLQYTAGIKAYLDVLIAETSLRAAQLNYLNALNQVLSSKLDMQKALGTIQY